MSQPVDESQSCLNRRGINVALLRVEQIAYIALPHTAQQSHHQGENVLICSLLTAVNK